jgi:hypothetical protein
MTHGSASTSEAASTSSNSPCLSAIGAIVIIVRKVGATLLAVAAIAVWFLMAPAEAKTPVVQTQEQVSDRSREIASVLADYELNEARTQGAPQQAVVNGWVTKDLLTIMAEQLNEALTRADVPPPVAPATPNDERIPALVGLLVLGLALAVATSFRPTAPTLADTRSHAVTPQQPGPGNVEPSGLHAAQQ